jgi:tetratricopeptide (TPR) repeat protein
MNARDRALLLLAVRRGLIGPDGANRAQALARPDASLSHSLVGSQVLRVRDAQALEAEIDGLAWSCGRCPPVPGEQLARLPALECPRCRKPLRPAGAPRSSSRQAAVPGSRPMSPSDLAHVGSDRVAGRRVGPYRLERELGRGSWGAVYRATREGSTEPCALKVLLDPLGADGEVLARFEREAQLPLQLQHPGIVRVLEVGRHQGHPYYAMEYCRGEDLKSKLARGPLPAGKAIDLVTRIAEALAYAHQRGVLHRDLKPANVLLREGSGAPVITDFGFAKARSLSASLTRSGAVFGTMYYMAPEQYRDSKHVGPRADVFALGVILYESLTGQRPFQGASAVQVSQALLHHDPPPPSQVAPGVSPQLDAVVSRALAKTPEERCSAEELIEALSACRVEAAPGAEAQVGGLPRATVIALAGVACLLALTVVFVAVALRGDGDGGGGAVASESPPAISPEVSPETSPTVEPPAVSPSAPSAEELLHEALAASRARESYETVAAALSRAAEAAEDDAALRTRVAAEQVLLAWRRARYQELDRLTRRLLDEPASEVSSEFLRLYRARALLELGRQEEGIQIYRSLVGRPPGGDVWLLCAQAEAVALQGKNDPEPASRALAQDPELVDALVLRARATLRTQPREAQRDLARAAELAPDDMHIYFWWGLADASVRDWEGKAAHLQTAIELSEPKPDETALLWRGHTLWLIDRFDEAEADLDRLLTLDPTDLEGLVWRAGCWYARGEEERAREAWRELDRSRGEELRELLQRGGRRVEVRNLEAWIRQAIGAR